ncbi:MAG: TldD/PmbA family protein [Candidatus Delongbacteria bacterium]|nr:TldD/PmbA family protein [Candidatus Delongbacteria bacterium]MBN2836811.1 TldD/PmbA family protein [Candidatus Delongbacteria bacterium]
MEKLLQIAKEKADQAEIYYSRCSDDFISIIDSKFNKVTSSIVSGYALRVIKDGKIGFSYTRNLIDREKLIEQALKSAEKGAKVEFSFPKTTKTASLKTYDPDIKLVNKQQLIKEAKEIVQYIKSKSTAQIDMCFYIAEWEKRLVNSAGTSLRELKSWYTFYLSFPFPETVSNISISLLAKKQQPLMDKAKIDHLLELYTISEKQIKVITGKMKVILMPEAVGSFIGRFNEAIHPFYFDNKTSPLLNKMEKQIFSDKLTIYQDPLDDSNLEASAFDGEGVARQKTVFVENGVLKNIYTDLKYSAKLNLTPTGNGGRSEIESSINPSVNCYSITPGNKSLEEMIENIEEGIIIYNLMDSYSGNILEGDYSIGVSAAFYIKNGKLIGRVKDAMINGNIYETLNQINAIENEVHFFGLGNFPAISFEEINVISSQT